MKSIEQIRATFDQIFKEIGKVVVGQEEMLKHT